MKKSLITLAAIALVSGAAFAQDPDPSGQFAQQVDSTLTRAEVNAQVFAAVNAGETSPSKIPLHGKVQPKLASSTTRAEVTAQYLADRDQADAMVAEDSGAAYFAKAATRHAIPEVVTGH